MQAIKHFNPRLFFLHTDALCAQKDEDDDDARENKCKPVAYQKIT